MENQEGFFHEACFINQNGQLQPTRVPVVQELVRQGFKQLPERFITVPLNQPIDFTSTHDISLSLPIIDVAKLQIGFESKEGRALELAKLADGSKDLGMFLITNHGIDCSVLDGVRDVVKGFFALSFEEKKSTIGSYADTDNMGYGRNFVKSESQPLDWIDRLAMKAAPKEAAQGLQVWPRRPPNFREAVEKYVEEARKVCDELLQALAEAISLERNAFLQYFEPQRSEMNVRVNYYPPCPRPDLAVGLTPHSDPSVITLLMQIDATGGLQVLRDRRWITVAWPCDTLLLNVGDLMEIMSNGKLKSPWHRAAAQTDVERYSVALFYNPPSQAEIRPVRDDENSSCEGYNYKGVVVGEYVKHFYEISPTPDKQAIKFAEFQSVDRCLLN